MIAGVSWVQRLSPAGQLGLREVPLRSFRSRPTGDIAHFQAFAHVVSIDPDQEPVLLLRHHLVAKLVWGRRCYATLGKDRNQGTIVGYLLRDKGRSTQDGGWDLEEEVGPRIAGGPVGTSFLFRDEVYRTRQPCSLVDRHERCDVGVSHWTT